MTNLALVRSGESRGRYELVRRRGGGYGGASHAIWLDQVDNMQVG